MSKTTAGRIRRTLGRVAAIGMLTATLVGGAAVGTAFADASTPPPPATPVVSNGLAVTGGDQNYWASDGCHYFATGGYMYTDVCMYLLVDTATGAYIPGQAGIFQSHGNSTYGAELLRIDGSTPSRVRLGVPGSDGVVRQWYVQGLTNQNQPIWITEPVNTVQVTVAGGIVPPAGDISPQQAAAQIAYNNAVYCASLPWLDSPYRCV